MPRKRQKSSKDEFTTIIMAAILLGLIWLGVKAGVHNRIGEMLVEPLRPK